MLANIPELLLTAVICVCFTIGYALLVQYSRYTAHKKAHFNDDDADKVAMASKFAFVPYMIIPVIFCGLSVFCGLAAVDYALSVDWISGSEGAAIWSVAASAAIYILADFNLVRHVGDAVYFDTIESKFHQAVAADLTDDEVKQAVADYLKNRKA
jgi:hypothetical protein